MVDSSAPLVFDISSEDDDDINLDYDWMSELFPEDEGEKERDDDDDDDVVVVSKVVANPGKKRKKVEADDDVDDDCVVLEGDPDKPVEVERDGDARDEEDLVITGEKGQIACRDYPHARHLCAKFPFASTPHEQHCHQCHCYVCDSRAPCIYWGNGNSITDHCHSTDQDPLWKAQRENFKPGNKALLPLLLPPDTSFLPPPPAPHTISVLVSASPRNQVASLPAIRGCATTTNSSVSNLNPRRTSISAVRTFPKNKFNPLLVSQELLGSRNNSYVNQNVGRHTPSNLGPQSMNRPRISKRQGSDRVVPPNSRYGHGSTNNNNVSQFSRNPHTLTNVSKKSLTYQHQHLVIGSHSQRNYGGSSLSMVPPSQAQVNRSNGYVGSVPCQPQTFNNQFGSGTGIQNTVSPQQSSLQTNMASTFANPVPSPSQGIPHPNINCFQNQVPSQWQVFSQPGTGGSFSFPPSVSCSQPNTGISNFENAAFLPFQALAKTGSTDFISPVYSQSQTYYQPNYSQQGKETESANCLPSLVGLTDQCNQTDSFPALDPVLTHQPPKVPEFDSPIIPENTNQYLYVAEPDPWMGGFIDTDEFDIGSPEAAIVDTGPLFDY